MMSRAAVRTSAVAELVSIVAVGVVVLMAAFDRESGSAPAQPAWWWTAYLLYLVVFLVADDYLPRPPRVTDDALVVALVVLGIAVFLLYPDPGWTAILLVVTAATAAFVWQPRAVVALIAVQTTAGVGLGVAIGVTTRGWPVSELVLSVLAVGSFQFFAALLVRTARREAEARTDLAVAHAELRAASTLLEVTSRDAERLRISRDLHDVVGHRLTALTLELEVASHLVSGEGRQHVTRARTIAKDLLGDVRATVDRMRENGHTLEPILRSLARDVPGLQVSLRLVEAGPVEGDQAQVVVLCVQEAITNTLRHSGANHLHVAVVADASGIRVETRDDGWGAAVVVPGNGLIGMRERFEALGGTLQICSSAGAGFVAVGHLPGRVPAGRSA